jgi:hypothetical protein
MSFALSTENLQAKKMYQTNADLLQHVEKKLAPILNDQTPYSKHIE